jgi:hypothetical protein
MQLAIIIAITAACLPLIWRLRWAERYRMQSSYTTVFLVLYELVHPENVLRYHQ